MNPKASIFNLLVAAVLYGAASAPILAQTAHPSFTPQTPIAASAPTTVPPLIPYNGVARQSDGKPFTGEVSMTFLIFKDESGGEPLFAETQEVAVDNGGSYKVQLGATLSNGLPSELFSTGEARWLEVQIAGEAPQSRVLLVSVPYALKAADAATLGGLPASAFVLAGSNSSAANRTRNALSVAPGAAPAATAATTTATSVTTTGGTSGSFALFSGASTVDNSNLFQTSTGIGVGTSAPAASLDVNGSSYFRGNLSLKPSGTATATAGVNSFPLTLVAQGYNSGTKASVNPSFQWQAVPTGNNTAAPSATLNLLSSTGTAAATATGLYINPNGTIHFATGQAFPYSGTITGVTAGTALLGGGTTGNVTLNVDTTKVVTGVTAGTGLTGGGTGGKLTLSLDTSKIPQLSAATNSFAGSLTVGGTVTAPQIAATNASFGGKVTSNGSLFPATGVADPNVGTNSYPIDFQSSLWDYFTGPLTKTLRLQSEPVLNGSGFTSASLNLLYGSAGASPAETGLRFGADGSVTASTVTAGTLGSTSVNTGNILVNQPKGLFATPNLVVQADEDGVARHAGQQLVVQGATHPGQQLLIGYITSQNTNSNGGMATLQATWTGVKNTGLFLQPNGGCVCIRTSNIGLDNQSLVVGQGQGLALADGWATYSSRRWKSNIQTLPDALSKVEKLRGVSYTLKATGKREIGVIAEEVGEVVPEVVSWEANGKDAQSVDYTRLTALLIEATKEQQAEIAALNRKLATALEQISLQPNHHTRRQTTKVNGVSQQVHSSDSNSGGLLHHALAPLAARQARPLAIAMTSGAGAK